MPRKGEGYAWTSGNPPIIDAHSLAKHRILGEYVREYIRVLTTNQKMERFALTLVDGFAGGGEYLLENGQLHDGSPLILLEAIQAVESEINAGRTKAIGIDAWFVFVEQNPKVFKYLEDVLERRKPNALWSARNIKPLCGSFEKRLDEIISHIKSRRGRSHRAIFVLDQYGYSDAPMDMIARIFRELPNAEVFLTLAVGWIWAYFRDPKSAAQRVRESLRIDDPYLERVAAGVGDPEEALHLAAPRAKESMLVVQRMLHGAFTAHSGAKHYTPFFIISRESNRPYWFLHLANSSRANDVVKAMHWKFENHFAHFGGAGLGMLTLLGYDPKLDPALTGQIPFAFDNPAKERTTHALLEDLPRRIYEKYPGGISAAALYTDVGNETPATSGILRSVLKALCVEGELEKEGGEGEIRRSSTDVQESDIVRVAKQRQLFSLLKKR